jgi:hypothetical protein
MSPYRTWRANYDVFYFDNLYININIFLKKYGYKLSDEKDKIVILLEDFCWAHTWITRYDSKKYIVYKANGIEDDCNWFNECIDISDWQDFYKEIEQDGIFDSSPAGQMQRNDFPLFIWKQIDLENSFLVSNADLFRILATEN